MASILLALASSVSWGISDFLGGVNSRRLPLISIMLIAQVVGLAMLLPLASLHGASLLDASSASFAVAGSLSGLVGISAMYRGMATGAISIVGPISATGAVVPVLFGLLRGERATPLQTAGGSLALLGIMLASRAGPDPDRIGRGPRVAAGVGFAVLAAVGFGGFFVLLHEASSRDVLWASVVQRATGVIVIGALAVIRRPSLAVGRRALPSLLLVGVLDTGANVLYALASTLGQVGLAAVLASLYPIATVTLARAVLRERLSSSQGTGVVCALAGVALIALP